MATLFERISADEIDRVVDAERKSIDYDTTEFTAEIMASKLSLQIDDPEADIYIPGYQRPLVWSVRQKSSFIESLLLALPIPFVFLCEIGDGRLEIVDGSQRLRTIKEFIDDNFVLSDLERLDLINGCTFSDLPPSQQRKLKNRPIRAVILSEKADNITRFDIFHRINSFGKPLTDAQIRKGAFRGRFYDIVSECASERLFAKLCPMHGKKDGPGEREELALRFFAYSECYLAFRHDVARFLNEYLKEQNRVMHIDASLYKARFLQMLEFVDRHFPYGFQRSERSKDVPRVRFEAISVGVRLALDIGEQLRVDNFAWLNSDKFRELTRTDASNSGPKLRARIEYVRDQLLRPDAG